MSEPTDQNVVLPATLMPRMSDAVMLGRLLAEWRATHDPALEPAIAQVGMKLARARGLLPVPTKAALEVAWHELAAAHDVGDVDRLLDARWPQTPKPALARINALALLDPDPRVAIKLVAIVDAYRTTGAVSLHRAADKLLARCPTRTILSDLEALDSSYYAQYPRSLAAVRALGIRAADTIWSRSWRRWSAIREISESARSSPTRGRRREIREAS